MERLTRKCNNTYFYNVDDVFVVGKRLGAFEDFMEEVGAESLDELENCIVDLKQETQALKDRWQKLKEWVEKQHCDNEIEANDINSPFTAKEYYGGRADSCKFILNKMQKLEKE